jgi:hypothetical protein
MGWNIEVAAVRTDTLAAAVPPGFAETLTTMGFENAVSPNRAPDLCAARMGEWVFVVDTGRRLSGATGYLATASKSTDLHVVRIAGAPLALHYHDGRLMAEARGLSACLRLAPRMDSDGERCAMDLLALQTGVMFSQDLGQVRFTRFQAVGSPSDRNASPWRVTTADS